MPAAAERKLSERLAQVEARTRHQFVVVTVTSLGGREPADYGRALGNFWRIGRAGANDGVLLVVASHERKVRIAVGYGLEKALTDTEAETIIQRDILPRFRAGHMAEGIIAGSEAIIREISQ